MTMTLALSFSIGLVSLIAVILEVTPAIMPPTVPLGVDVPRERVDEPVIRTATRAFRWGVLAGWALSTGVAVVASFFSPAVATLIPVLLMVLLGTGAYTIARTAILRAKRDGAWYHGVPVRLSARVTASRGTRVPVAWLVACLVAIAVTAAIGVAWYASLPSLLPLHWNAAGAVNRYAPKTPWSVFAVLLLALAISVGLFLLSFLARAPAFARIRAGGAAGTRQAAQRSLMAGLIGQLSLAVVLMLCTTQVLVWRGSGGMGWIPALALIAAIVVILAVFLMRVRRLASPTPAGRDAPDADRYWKAGLVYVNRDDPAIMVPKRFGVGWTVNLGSPGGMGIALALLLILVGALALAVISPRA